MSAAKIRELNDRFRTTMTGGRVMMTAGVDALPSDVKAMVIRRVATFSEFTPDNDPHGEHDFGNFTLAGRKFFFKIDYYDARWSSARRTRPIRRRRPACSRSCSQASTDPLPRHARGFSCEPERQTPSTPPIERQVVPRQLPFAVAAGNGE